MLAPSGPGKSSGKMVTTSMRSGICSVGDGVGRGFIYVVTRAQPEHDGIDDDALLPWVHLFDDVRDSRDERLTGRTTDDVDLSLADTEHLGDLPQLGSVSRQ